MRRVYRHPVGIGIAFQERYLSRGKILLVLFEVLRRDRKQWLLAREWVNQRLTFDVTGRKLGQATGPWRNRARSITGFLGTYWCQFVPAKTCGLFGCEFPECVLRHQAKRSQECDFCECFHGVLLLEF